jgi:uncharacterized phage infection (PIP) family protein YhgE
VQTTPAPQATPAVDPAQALLAPQSVSPAPQATTAGDGGELPPDVLDALSDVYPDNADDPDDAYEAAGAEPATPLKDVDLVELDALLDDMLSNAPISGPGPGDAAPRFTESSPSAGPDGVAPPHTEKIPAGNAANNGEPPPQAPPPPAGQTSDASLPARAESRPDHGAVIGFEEAANLAAIPGLLAEVTSLRGELETLLAATAESARTETEGTARTGKRLDSFSSGLASLASRLEDLELVYMAGANKEKILARDADAAASGLAELEERTRQAETGLAALEEQTRQAETGLAALEERTRRAEAGLAALEERTRQAEAGLAAAEERAQRQEDAYARLHADLDKMAAAAAARVIREELAALVAENH